MSLYIVYYIYIFQDGLTRGVKYAINVKIVAGSLAPSIFVLNV